MVENKCLGITMVLKRLVATDETDNGGETIGQVDDLDDYGEYMRVGEGQGRFYMLTVEEVVSAGLINTRVVLRSENYRSII